MKPTPLKIIQALVWLSLIATSVVIGVSFLALLIPPGKGIISAFLSGGLDALGYDHASFGAYEYGEVIGFMLVAAAPALLMFFAVRAKRLWIIRTAAITWLLMGAANGQPLIPGVVAVLSFLPSIRRYCKSRASRGDEPVDVQAG